MSERKRDFVLFLEDILDAIGKIERYSRGLSLGDPKRSSSPFSFILQPSAFSLYPLTFDLIVNNVPQNATDSPKIDLSRKGGYNRVTIGKQ